MTGPLFVLTKLLGHFPPQYLPPIRHNGFVREPTRCKDGTKFLLQISEHHYCTPRNNVGPYTHVEVWNVEAPVPKSWAAYGGNGGPYAYLPAEFVAEFIDAHGGLA